MLSSAREHHVQQHSPHVLKPGLHSEVPTLLAAHDSAEQPFAYEVADADGQHNPDVCESSR